MSENSNTITVVCGLGRSGSSLMMQMLHAAGFSCAGKYPAFELYQQGDDLSQIKLSSFAGGAIKLLDPERTNLPAMPFRFIFMRRSREQQTLSILKMLRYMGAIKHAISDEMMEKMKEALRADEYAALETIHAHGPVLKVRFEDLIDRPESTIWTINEFLGISKENEMRMCIKARSSTCYPGFIESILLEEMNRPSPLS